MGTLANSEDPDEMKHNAAFHQCLHCLLKIKQPSGTQIHYALEAFTCDPLELHNGQSHTCTYSVNMYGRIHQNTEG